MNEAISPPDTVRLTKRCKDQLITLKRKTGITQWNVLCRWALAVSLAMETDPPTVEESLEGGVEMAWRVFSGKDGDMYWAALVTRDRNDPSATLRAHIHRGVQQLLSRPGNTIGAVLPWNVLAARRADGG